MANYRRNLIAGGSYFFTVNLADCRLSLSLSTLPCCGGRFDPYGCHIRSRSKPL
jgi:hypothetical protein